MDKVVASGVLKKYWLRSTQKEIDKEVEKEPGKPDKPDKPEDSGRKKWPLPGRGFFVQIP